MKWIFNILFSKKAERQCAIHNVRVIFYDPKMTMHKPDKNASKCYKGLDEAYLSMSGTDFDYMLNRLQNKINTYRKMRGS